MRSEYTLHDGDVKVGSLGAISLPGRARLDRLWVHPLYRGRGLSRRLLLQVATDADLEGVALEGRPWGLQDVKDEQADRTLFGEQGIVPTLPVEHLQSMYRSVGFVPVEDGEGFHRWLRQPVQGDTVPVELHEGVPGREAAVSPVKAHLPWADLQGLSPEQSAFQRTHPAVRNQVLRWMDSMGHHDALGRLVGVHRAQSQVDRVRAQQGRPSPYRPAHMAQPYLNPMDQTMRMRAVASSEPRLTWDEIGERHPDVYGDPEVHGEDVLGDGNGIGWAVAHLAFNRPGHEDPDEGSWDLDFHLRDVPVGQIDYARAGMDDPRVASARRWYQEAPDEVVPPVLVHRHGVYQVADGHHRSEAAGYWGLPTIPAYVAQSPHENEPFSDGGRGPYHGAEPMHHEAARPKKLKIGECYYNAYHALMEAPDGWTMMHGDMLSPLDRRPGGPYPNGHAVLFDPEGNLHDPTMGAEWSNGAWQHVYNFQPGARTFTRDEARKEASDRDGFVGPWHETQTDYDRFGKEASVVNSKPIFDTEMGGPSGKLQKLMDNRDDVDPDPHLSDLYNDAKWHKDYERLVGGRHGFAGGYQPELDESGGVSYHRGGVWTNTMGKRIPVAHVVKPVLAANPERMTDRDPSQEVRYFAVSSIPGDEGDLYRTLQEAANRPLSLAGRRVHPGRGDSPRELSEGFRARQNGGKTASSGSGLNVEEFEGEEGNNDHITRNEQGMIPIDWVRNMPGARGEIPGDHRNRKGEQWDKFKDALTNGSGERIHEPVFIAVEHGSEPKLYEGNHRRDAYVELGATHVPAFIRYFGHAERQGTVGERAAMRHQATVVSDEDAALADELRDNGGEVNEDGTVTLYHHTSPESAEDIYNSGRMHGREDGIFFTTRGDQDSQGAGRGGAVVKLRVPLNVLQLDDAFGDEAHVKVPTRRPGDSVDVSSWLHRTAEFMKRQGAWDETRGEWLYDIDNPDYYMGKDQPPSAFSDGAQPMMMFKRLRDGTEGEDVFDAPHYHPRYPACEVCAFGDPTGAPHAPGEGRHHPSYGDHEYTPAGDLPSGVRLAAASDESGLKAAGIAVIALDTGRVLMQQRALNPLHCSCGMGVTWDEMNGYQHSDGSVSHDDSDMSVSEMLDQGYPCSCCLGRGENEQGSECTSCDGTGGHEEPPFCSSPCRDDDELDETGIDKESASNWEWSLEHTDPVFESDSSWRRHLRLPGTYVSRATRDRSYAIPNGDGSWTLRVDDGSGKLGFSTTRHDSAQSLADSVRSGLFGSPDETGLEATSALEYDPNEGTWEFPGGKLDPGESLRAAAIREFREEVGQDLPPGVFVGAWLAPGGITVSAATDETADWRNPDGWARWRDSGWHRSLRGEGWPEESSWVPSEKDFKTNVTQPMYTLKSDGAEEHVHGWIPPIDAMEKEWSSHDAEHPLHHEANTPETPQGFKDLEGLGWNVEYRPRLGQHRATLVDEHGTEHHAYYDPYYRGWDVRSSHPSGKKGESHEKTPQAADKRARIVGRALSVDPALGEKSLGVGYNNLNTTDWPVETRSLFDRLSAVENWWEERKPAVPRGTLEDPHDSWLKWDKVADPDHYELLNPARDPFMELKSMDDAGIPFSPNSQEGETCENCWMENRWAFPQDEDHFKETGHKPVVAPRYIAKSAADDGPFYHGTAYEHVPGDEIDPNNSRNYFSDEFGEDQPWGTPAPRVFFTRDQDAAARYGVAPGGLFRVEPTGPYSEHPWEKGTLVSAHPLRIVERVEPKLGKVAAKAPVYKGFIYLIQRESDIDLGKREIANPDDPDGDMSEQSAWWDIEHARKNPALRKECKTGVPWDELELWADKSVRSNKEIKESFARLAALPRDDDSQAWRDQFDALTDPLAEEGHGQDGSMWQRAREILDDPDATDQDRETARKVNDALGEVDRRSQEAHQWGQDNPGRVAKFESAGFKFNPDSGRVLFSKKDENGWSHTIFPSAYEQQYGTAGEDGVGWHVQADHPGNALPGLGPDLGGPLPGRTKSLTARTGSGDDDDDLALQLHEHNLQHSDFISNGWEPTQHNNEYKKDDPDGTSHVAFPNRRLESVPWYSPIIHERPGWNVNTTTFASPDDRVGKTTQAQHLTHLDAIMAHHGGDLPKLAMPLTQDVPRVNQVIRSGQPGFKNDVYSDARVDDTTLPSGDWIRKLPQHRHLTNEEYNQHPSDAMYFLDQAGEESDLEEFASRLGHALSDPSDEPIAPKAFRGHKMSDPGPAVYVRKYPDMHEMRTTYSPGVEDRFRDTPRGKLIGYFHSVLSDGDKVGYHNMGLLGDRDNEDSMTQVSIDHGKSSLPLYASALSGDGNPKEMRWHHEFGLSPYEHHFLGENAAGWPTPKGSNPLAPGDTERAKAALETMRPWARSRGREGWINAAHKRMDILGQHGAGVESMFPYRMAHERAPIMRTGAGKATPQKAYPLIRDLISAGRPQFAIRTLDQVDPAHHDMITGSERPFYYEENDPDPNLPKIYTHRYKGRSIRFLAPLVHKQTGQTGWVRGLSDEDPSQWRLYRDSEIANAVAGSPVERMRSKVPLDENHRPIYGPRGDARYERQWARGTPPPEPEWQEGDVPLDEEGHQLVEPRQDYITEPQGRYPWDFDWDKPGDHPLTERDDEWWRAPSL